MRSKLHDARTDGGDPVGERHRAWRAEEMVAGISQIRRCGTVGLRRSNPLPAAAAARTAPGALSERPSLRALLIHRPLRAADRACGDRAASWRAAYARFGFLFGRATITLDGDILAPGGRALQTFAHARRDVAMALHRGGYGRGHDHRKAVVRSFANGDVERDLAQERHFERVRPPARAAVTEDVGARAAMGTDEDSSCSRRCRAPAR